jgi:hypothetical protein
LGQIRMPTLIVAGRLDTLVPLVHPEMLHAGIPQSELLVLNDSSHGGVVDALGPDRGRYGVAVRAFVGRRATHPYMHASDPVTSKSISHTQGINKSAHRRLNGAW